MRSLAIVFDRAARAVAAKALRSAGGSDFSTSSAAKAQVMRSVLTGQLPPLPVSCTICRPSGVPATCGAFGTPSRQPDSLKSRELRTRWGSSMARPRSAA
jgi:hypothetical protein